MKAKLLLILILAWPASRLAAQESASVADSYYTKCSERLKPITFEEKYKSLQKQDFCSLFAAIAAFEAYHEEKPLKAVFENRIIEIATLFYEEGHPIYLISGMDSYRTAAEQNKETNDDNGCIYVSVGECIISKSLNEAKKIFNSETTRLIKQQSN